MPNPREPGNRLRIDLYRRLLPEIQREDQKSGAHGYVFHWDDPDSEWDELLLAPSDPASLEAVWEAVGLSPLYQELFYALEQVEGEDVAVLESLDAVIDPLRCPLGLLGNLAASLGYRLAEGLSEDAQRAALLGLIDAFKSRGQWISWKVFYRLLGFEIVEVFPLWKRDVFEANEDYARLRYETLAKVNIPVGPAAQTAFVGTLADAPIKPGTVRFRDTGLGGITVRDDEGGILLGPAGPLGTIDLRTGDFRLTLPAPSVGPVVVDLERITDERPYHAARIDVDILLSPMGAPIPLITEEGVTELLVRMEEVRPIHVLLRALALVAEIRDDFGPTGATDGVACTTHLRDHRDGGPPPGDPPPGRDYNYMIDVADVPDEDTMFIGVTPTVGTPQTTVHLEDRAESICPLDTLVIEGAPGGTQYW
jgi:hypothetical protein